jgi:two-component system, OmpR family, sensor histidine kinase BaeS
MTEARRALTRSPLRRDTLALRLTLGFLGVALAAIALLAGLIVAFSAADVSDLASHQRTDVTHAIAGAAAAGWDLKDSWAGADLSPALDLASRTGADAEIRDTSGAVVASTGLGAPPKVPMFSAPVMVRGKRVGQALVWFTGSGFAAADTALQAALLRAITTAAALVALGALLTALAIARRLTRPLAHIVSVTRAMGGGEREARVGEVSAPTELRELATAFDQMADMLDKNEQLRRNLVADLAHELRTPVAVLQAGHEALLDGIAEPTPEELASLRDEVLRLARMVDALQTLSAADAAAYQMQSRRCDLAGVAAVAADSLAGRFEAAGVVLDRRLAETYILGDPHWLHHLVINLLTNSLKFSPADGLVIIQVGRADSQAVLTVTDFGTGIPAEELPHVFERFWRGSQAAKTSGTGIGLAIASQLAAAHGGKLTATSQLGEGTRMTLTLPIALRRSATGRRGATGRLGREGSLDARRHAARHGRHGKTREQPGQVPELSAAVVSASLTRCLASGMVIPGQRHTGAGSSGNRVTSPAGAAPFQATTPTETAPWCGELFPRGR